MPSEVFSGEDILGISFLVAIEWYNEIFQKEKKKKKKKKKQCRVARVQVSKGEKLRESDELELH